MQCIRQDKYLKQFAQPVFSYHQDYYWQKELQYKLKCFKFYQFYISLY